MGTKSPPWIGTDSIRKRPGNEVGQVFQAESVVVVRDRQPCASSRETRAVTTKQNNLDSPLLAFIVAFALAVAQAARMGYRNGLTALLPALRCAPDLAGSRRATLVAP